MIEKLKGDKELRENVLAWVVSKGLEKQYKKCCAKLCKECVGVGKSDTFRGRYCYECNRVYKSRMHAQAREKK